MSCALLVFVLSLHVDGFLSWHRAMMPPKYDVSGEVCAALAERGQELVKLSPSQGSHTRIAWAMVEDGDWIAWDFHWKRERDETPSVRRIFYRHADLADDVSSDEDLDTLADACLARRDWFRRSVVKKDADGNHARAVTVCWSREHGLHLSDMPRETPAEYAQILEHSRNLPPVR